MVDLLNDYGARLADAMKLEGLDERAKKAAAHSVAKAADITYQAVMKVINGTSKALSAENNSLAAISLNVNTDWLATGKGAKDRAPPTSAAGPALSIEARAVAEAFDKLPLHNEHAINIKFRTYQSLLNTIALAQAAQAAAPAPQLELPPTDGLPLPSETLP